MKNTIGASLTVVHVMAKHIRRCGLSAAMVLLAATLGVLPSAVSASIRVTNPYDFGSVPVGEAREITLMIRNRSSVPMRGVASVVSPPFTLNNNDHAAFTIAPWSNKKLTLRFAPMRAGDFRTSLCLSYCYAANLSVCHLGVPPSSTAGCADGANTYGPYTGSGDGSDEIAALLPSILYLLFNP